jgi:fumarylacetoacetate (FAA) hydrolase family protein
MFAGMAATGLPKGWTQGTSALMRNLARLGLLPEPQ